MLYIFIIKTELYNSLREGRVEHKKIEQFNKINIKKYPTFKITSHRICY